MLITLISDDFCSKTFSFSQRISDLDLDKVSPSGVALLVLTSSSAIMDGVGSFPTPYAIPRVSYSPNLLILVYARRNFVCLVAAPVVLKPLKPVAVSPFSPAAARLKVWSVARPPTAMIATGSEFPDGFFSFFFLAFAETKVTVASVNFAPIDVEAAFSSLIAPTASVMAVSGVNFVGNMNSSSTTVIIGLKMLLVSSSFCRH